MTARVIDYSALTNPVTPDEVASWKAQAKASGAAWARTSAQTVVTIASLGCAGVAFLTVFVGVGVGASTAGASSPARAIGPLIFTAILLAVAAAVIASVVRRSRRGGKWQRWVRLDRFAKANGMSFTPQQGDPNYPGEIFQLGRDRMAIDHLDTTSGRFLDMGNYRWTTGSGKSQETHLWGFLALSLDRSMPNIVLDSRANNSIFGSNLPATLRKDQVLQLEGDFDRYFTLYCPKEYERDALYIFTPDLMALLIDEAAPYDVELVDEWMFVYSSKPFELADPAVLQRLFRIADTVGTKALDQTERYADERVGDFDANVVAPQGARLRRGTPVLAVVVVVIFVVIWGWTFLGPLLR